MREARRPAQDVGYFGFEALVGQAIDGQRRLLAGAHLRQIGLRDVDDDAQRIEHDEPGDSFADTDPFARFAQALDDDRIGRRDDRVARQLPSGGIKFGASGGKTRTCLGDLFGAVARRKACKAGARLGDGALCFVQCGTQPRSGQFGDDPFLDELALAFPFLAGEPFARFGLFEALAGLFDLFGAVTAHRAPARPGRGDLRFGARNVNLHPIGVEQADQLAGLQHLAFFNRDVANEAGHLGRELDLTPRLDRGGEVERTRDFLLDGRLTAHARHCLHAHLRVPRDGGEQHDTCGRRPEDDSRS